MTFETSHGAIHASRASSRGPKVLLVLGLAAIVVAFTPGCDRTENLDAPLTQGAGNVGAGSAAVPAPVSEPIELREADDFPGEPGSLAGCNVLLVTLDTTRADHLNCYGYRNVETPTLDRLASEGVLFEQAKAVAPHTLASHTSILTGLYPASHGVRVNWFHRVKEETQTLAETFQSNGYQTGAFVSTFVLLSRFGVGQGFGTFDGDLSAGQTSDHAKRESIENTPERRGDITADRALKWLRSVAGQRFFMWMHLFDPHGEYKPPEPYLTRYAASPYDGEIAFADAMLGRLISALDELDLADDTLVIVVGDHGEGLGQHQEKTHSLLTYESTIHVPLIMRCGSRLGGGVRVARPVSQVDVVPTALALLGLRHSARVDGIDLTSNRDPKRPIFFETLHGLIYHGWAPIAGVFDGDLKYIESPSPELFDLSLDPGELNNLYDEQPETAARLRGLLPGVFGDDLELVDAAVPTTRPGDEDLRKLEALGYIGGSGEIPEILDRRDPKQMAPILDRVHVAIRAESLDGIIENIRPITDEYPDFHAAWKYLAKAYVRKGDEDKAAEAFERCYELLPDGHETNCDLALIRVRQERYAEAIPLLDRVVEACPGHLTARYLLSTTLLRLGRAEEAAEHMERVFEIEPEYEDCPAAMVALFSATERFDDLTALFRNRLAAEPRSPKVCAALGDFLARKRRFVEAAEVFRAGIAVMPDEPLVVKGWATLLAACPDDSIRNVADAIDLLERYRDRISVPDPAAMYTLAAVYGQQQRVAEAINTAAKARVTAVQTGNAILVADFDKLLARLQAQREGMSP